MAKKAEPKFKITETRSGRMVNGAFKSFVEQRLDKVTLPKSFDGVLVIPQEVTQIGAFVCKDKTEIKEVVLPENLKYLDVEVFAGCENLEKIILPESLLSLGESCFADCTSLTELRIPASVNALYGTDFIGLPSNVSVIIDEANPYYKIEEGAVLSKDGKTFVRLLADVEDYDVKEGVTCIGQAAFKGCQQLKKVVLPASVEEVQMYVFERCPNLTNVVVKSDAIKNELKDTYSSINFE